jgi:hypothetical protein
MPGSVALRPAGRHADNLPDPVADSPVRPSQPLSETQAAVALLSVNARLDAVLFERSAGFGWFAPTGATGATRQQA